MLQENRLIEAISYNNLMNNPPPHPAWVIDQLIPKGGISVLGGDGGVGKSWLALHMSQCVATGNDFLGQFKVTQGKVLMIDEENPSSLIHSRYARLAKSSSITDTNLGIEILCSQDIMVSNQTDFTWLKNKIQETQPSLITIDSLIRVHTADENSAREMQAVFRRIKSLIAGTEASVLLTHHASRSYDRKKGALRGSTDIRNFADSVLFCTSRKEYRIVEHDKARWAIGMQPFAFGLNDVGDATQLVFLGFISDKRQFYKEHKYKITRDLIAACCKDGNKHSRQELIAAGKLKGIGETTMDKYLKQMETENVLESDYEVGKPKNYRLKFDTLKSVIAS